MANVLVALLLVAWLATPFAVGWALRHDRISDRRAALVLLLVAPVAVVAYGVIKGYSLILMVPLALIMCLPLSIMYEPLVTFMGDHRRPR